MLYSNKNNAFAWPEREDAKGEKPVRSGDIVRREEEILHRGGGGTTPHSPLITLLPPPTHHHDRHDRQGYHEFFRSKSKTSEPHDWETFLESANAKFGDDNLKSSIEKALEDKSTTEELKNLPAVFELAVVHPSRPKARVKCYIGKCMDFQKCSREILTDDNHYLTKFLRLALQHGNSVVRRYVYYVEHAAAGRGGRKAVDVECLVGKAYDRMLSFYDYPWNEQAGSGSGTRGIYAVPKTALCCVPSGVDVIRIHPTMLK